MISLKNGKYTYNPKDIIGGGNYGIIYKCLVTQTSEKAVVKIIKTTKLKKLGTYGKQLLERELQIHKKASDSQIPYFVKLIDSFHENQDLYLLMERCNYDLTKLYKEDLKVETSIELVFQIAIGLLYLHTMGIIH